MKSRIILQALYHDNWVPIAAGADLYELEELSRTVSLLYVFRAVKEVVHPLGMCTPTVIKSWVN